MLLGPQSFQTAGAGQPGLPGAPSLYIHAFPLAVLPGSHLPAVLSLSPVELAASCPVHPGRSGVSPLVSCASSCLWPWSLQGVPPTCVLAVALLLPTSPWACHSSPPRARLPPRHQLPQHCWCQLAGPGDQGGAKWDLGIWVP